MAKQSNLPEIVEARRNLQSKLKDLGITPDRYDEVMELLGAFQSSDLDLARNEQFHDTAYNMLVMISSASDKNVKKLSALLRQFANHVTQNVLHPKASELEEIVDSIPEMISNEE